MSRPLDVERIRRDFPLLQREVYGKPLVYLDSAATSQKPQPVLDAIQDYYSRYNANVHRALHRLAEEATEAYEGARRKVARFLGAPDPRGVIFTRGATEALNLVAATWGRQHVKAGDRILVTEMEHHSNLVPWHLLARQTDAEIAGIPITEEGRLDLEAYRRLLTPRTRIVAVTHKSNVLGTRVPLAEMVQEAHAAGAVVVVDGAQAAPHGAVDVAATGADFYAVSSHKMCGPTGIGALLTRPELMEDLPPYQGGGEMIQKVELDHSTYASPPHRFEAGTPDIAGAVGWGAALDYLQSVGMDRVAAHEADITAYALQRFREVGPLQVFGPENPVSDRAGIVSWNDPDVHPHDLAMVLDREGVAIRAGHHCAQPLMGRLGVVALARASFYLYTTRQEIDLLIAAIARAREYFGHGLGLRASR